MTGPRETQPERTAFAWTRTALGAVAVAVLVGHRAVVGGSPALLVPAGGCALLGLALLGAGRDRRVREVMARDEPVADARLAALATAVVVVVGVVAALSVLVARTG